MLLLNLYPVVYYSNHMDVFNQDNVDPSTICLISTVPGFNDIFMLMHDCLSTWPLSCASVNMPAQNYISVPVSWSL